MNDDRKLEIADNKFDKKSKINAIDELVLEYHTRKCTSKYVDQLKEK